MREDENASLSLYHVTLNPKLVHVANAENALVETNNNGCPDGEEALQLCATCPSDLNDDGVVSVADVLFLLGQFGNVCP